MSPKSFRRGDPETGCAVLLVATCVVASIAALLLAGWLLVDLFGG